MAIKKRRENTREERRTESGAPVLSFSFRYLDESQAAGQTLEEWDSNGWLARALVVIKEISLRSLSEAESDGLIKFYGDFPPNSEFRPPANVPDGARWGVLQKQRYQKMRIAGFLHGNIFHVVFLDASHKFWPMSR